MMETTDSNQPPSPSQFQQRWQQLQLQERDSKTSPGDRADIWRSMLANVHYARATNILSHDAASSMFLSQAESYAGVVDNPHEGQGLNNYAEGAMSLLEGKRNESQKWKSGLSTQLDCVKKFLQTNQKAKETVIPPGKENALLDIPRADEETGYPSAASTAFYKPLPQPKPYNCGPRTVASQGCWPPQPKLPGVTQPRIPPPAASASVDNTLGGMPNAGQHAGQEVSFWKLGQGNLGRRENVSNVQAAGVSTSRPPTAGNFSRNPSATLFSDTSRYNRRPVEKRPREPSVEEDEEENNQQSNVGSFRTAKEQLARDNQKKYNRGGGGGGGSGSGYANYGTTKKSLGTRRGPGSRFVPPVINRDDDADDGGTLVRRAGGTKPLNGDPDEAVDERLRNIEPKMVELVMSEIMDHGPPVTWEDVAGLEFAKKTIKEIVVWPMLRPDIFTGLRGPPKGLLLFGPPGTGKTLIGKCIASQSKSTFFSISASSLTSKWVGEGEKMVRALFAVSRVHQPAVIFIDELDSLLSQRSDSEHEASRRIKTEFLVQLDGATTGEDDRILVVGATNRPQEIDEAARRRFVKRLYIPLPETEARKQIVTNLMSQQQHGLSQSELGAICHKTQGYSGADMANLCREAALGPIRSLSFGDIENITPDQVRPIVCADFEAALTQVRASVSEKDLDVYLDWNKQYGSWGIV